MRFSWTIGMSPGTAETRMTDVVIGGQKGGGVNVLIENKKDRDQMREESFLIHVA